MLLLNVGCTEAVPDVELLLKTVEGSPAKISRAEGEIAFGLDKIMEVAESTDSAKWLAHEADLADWQVVNTVDEAARVFVVYSAHKTPFPVTHRELLYVRKTHRFPDGRIMIVGKSINDPQQMAREGRVRAVVLAGWLFTPIDENKTRVVRIIQLDPKGNIPAFLINTHNEKTARAIPLLASQIH